MSCVWCRNLNHPVAQQLESLVEQYNPDYDRKLKQRTKEVWGPKLMKSEYLQNQAGLTQAQVAFLLKPNYDLSPVWQLLFVGE